MKVLLLVVGVITLFAFSGCAGKPIYHPGDTPSKTTMTSSQAKKRIKELLQTQFGALNGFWKVTDVQYRSDGMLVTQVLVSDILGAPGTVLTTFYSRSATALQVMENGSDDYSINCDGCNGWQKWTGSDAKTSAVDFADALYALKDDTGDVSDLTAFHAIALDYRTKHPKPEIPEGTRKFQIQAEHAFDAKNYNDAIDYYEEGLLATAWWPEGHYNRALVLAKQSRFEEAVVEMKKYLDLIPDAPDARKMQDKVYVWQGKHETPAEPVTPTAPALRPRF